MIDKKLELKIKRLKEFTQLWVKFHDMYKNSISLGTISPEAERTFLDTKSLIARRYQALKDLLELSSSYEDRTFDVISQVLSLKSVSAISDLSLNKIENDWHNSYIQLNKLLGELEGRQEALRKVSRIGLFVNRSIQSPLFNLILAIIIIFCIYAALTYIQKSDKVKKAAPTGKIEFQKNK
jgi:hypothetical protein